MGNLIIILFHKERFNRAHTKTRTIIEQSFGVLKRRFHALHVEIRQNPGRVSRIIMACCVLNNLALSKWQRGNFDDDHVVAGQNFELMQPEDDVYEEDESPRALVEARRRGFAKRNNIANNNRL